MLVIVNGSPTSDPGSHEIAELRAELATSVGRIGKLEDLLAASVDIIAELKGHLAATSVPKLDTSKFNTLSQHSIAFNVCVW